MSLTKLALDAQKARAMAEAAGIIPQPGSAWKWALRNVRDGRGDLLTGRELAQAKENMGRLTNRQRQRFNSLNRATGGRYELGMALGELPSSLMDKQPVRAALAQQLKKSRINQLTKKDVQEYIQLTGGDHPTDAPMKTRNIGKMHIGTETAIPTSVELGANAAINVGEATFAHTHPSNNRFVFANKYKTNPSYINNQHFISSPKSKQWDVLENIHLKRWMPNLNIPSHVADDQTEMAQQQLINAMQTASNKADRERVRQQLVNYVQKENQEIEANYKRLRDPVLIASPSGFDLNVFRHQPNKPFPIYVPEKNVDAVHQVKDQRVSRDRIWREMTRLHQARKQLGDFYGYNMTKKEYAVHMNDIDAKMKKLHQEIQRMQKNEVRSVYFKTEKGR